MKINYNPYSKDFWDDSWNIYKDLRDNDPVHCMEDFGGAWALSRFEDIWNAHLGSYKDYTSIEGTSPPPLLLGDDSGPQFRQMMVQTTEITEIPLLIDILNLQFQS